MKPTQEQILRALNKLVRENKTELKAEKIELGLAKDATDLSKELIEFVKIEEEIRKKAIKSYKAIIGEKSNVSKTLTESKNAVKKFEKISGNARQ